MTDRPDTALDRRARTILWIVLAAGVVSYWPSLDKSFLAWDDNWQITANPYVQSFGPRNTLRSFTQTYGGQYSPVPMLVEAVKWRISGGHPLLFNVFSVVIHLVNALLVFRLLERLFHRPGVALVAAALFLLHPLQVETIAWLSASTRTGLFAAFCLAAMHAYLSYVRGGARGWYALAVGFAVLSCCCKEQAVMVAPSILAVDYVERRRLLSARVIVEKIPFFAVALVFGLVAVSATAGGTAIFAGREFALHERVVFASYAVVHSILKLAAPLNLSAIYPYPVEAGAGLSPRYWLYPVALLALVGGFVVALNRSRLVAFGLGFFALHILFSLANQLVNVRPIVMADRYVYLGSVGLFLVVGWAAARIGDRSPAAGRVAVAALALYAVTLGVLTFQRTAVWKNDLTLWDDTVAKFPISLVHDNRGRAHLRAGDVDAALADFDRAIELDADNYSPYVNRGGIALSRNRLGAAMDDFDRALELRPESATALAGRSAIFEETRQYGRAIADLDRAIELEPTNYTLRFNLGLLYHRTGRHREAVEHLGTYVSFQPRHAVAHELLGVSHARLGDHAAAIERLDEAIRLDPERGSAYLERSRSLLATDRRADALRDAERARRLGTPVDPAYIGSLR